MACVVYMYTCLMLLLRLVTFHGVKCAASANKDVEVCETAKAEIADLKTLLIALEDDVSH